MPLTSILFFSVAVVIVLLSVRKGADILSPGRFYALVWSVSFGLTELKLSGLQYAWPLESWLVILAGVTAFLVGTFVSYVLNLDKHLVSVSRMREVLHEWPLRENRLFWSIVVSSFMYLASYLVVYLVKGFIPMFSIRGALSRTEFQIFGFGVVLHSVVFIFFFTGLYLVQFRNRRTKKLMLVILGIISAVTFLFLLLRFQYIMAGVMVLTLLYYSTRHLRPRNALIYVALLSVFFYLVSTIRTGQILQQYLYTSSKMRFGPHLAPLTEPYMYVAMNLENLAHGIDRLENFTFGYFSFDFITALTGLKHWLSKYFSIDPTPFLNSTYNTYSALWPYYRDFGTVGMVLIQLCLGFGIGSLYYSMRRAPSIDKVTAYSVAVFVMLISISQSPIAWLWFVYNLAMLFIILKIAKTPGKTPRFGDPSEARRI